MKFGEDTGPGPFSKKPCSQLVLTYRFFTSRSRQVPPKEQIFKAADSHPEVDRAVFSE